jgi:hypothetical protein
VRLFLNISRNTLMAEKVPENRLTHPHPLTRCLRKPGAPVILALFATLAALCAISSAATYTTR